ncbi:fumarylacetoacetate hydrolase family protein [Ornithinibacillus massiliensis]|uniref:Fumarylacetoacetate hydrolase family protein n=1 Tax=Ornithinibacillus massiliensis TaxID=1944633 RepID=A0ABS5MB77_9BACI|nr:fumarylacetoacetate hydrolase family protein [Ornithinibacillus massiliensis]MBS3679038.1 fumarylacetoacetate hydrolase family protein [Ornithinibacillus massiliensis]
MKLVSYRLINEETPLRVGIVLENGDIVDAQQVYEMYQQKESQSKLETSLPSDPTIFFKQGLPLIEKVKEAYGYAKDNRFEKVKRYERREVYLGPVISEPSKIICVGRNYVEHAQEMKSEIPEYPVLFAKFANSLIGADDAIEKTSFTDKLDYEVELTVVIGKEAAKVKREDALDYIAGYTIGNDVSARDLQKRTPQWLQGKTVDRSTPIGPWIVTPDEVGDPGKLDITCYVNGEVRQSSNTEKFIFDIPYLIEFISHLITLNPGDIIMTGTPDGVAFGMETPKFLQDGDIVRLEISKIGHMENRVKQAD